MTLDVVYVRDDTTLVEVASTINIIGSGGSGAAGVFVRSVSAAGIVANLVWAVSGKHLEAATTDSEQITITALIEGGTDYQPTATIGRVDATITETSTTRIFQAVATVPLAVGETVIDVVASTGGRDSVLITRLSGGPAVLDIVIAPPTAPQTHYRAGQTAVVAILTEPSATQVTVSAYGASAGSVTVPVAGGIATATITISSALSSSPVKVTAYNAFGTAGDVATSDDVPIDQTVPSLSLGVMYPTGQYAVEHGEIAVLSTSVSGHSSVSYDIPASLTGSAEYAPFKDLTCASTVNELISTVTVTAYKASNASQVVMTQSIRIANVAPSLSISIDGNPSRLTRSPLGTSYTLRVVASQPLMSLAIDGVTMVSSADRMTWTGTIKIYDTTPIGGYVVDVDVIGAAGHAGSGSRTFTVGGFSSRTVTWPAFSRVAPLGIPVYDQARTTCVVGAKSLTRQTDATDRANGYYIADANAAYNPVGSYIALSDVAFAGSNTTGTLQGTVQET